MGLGLTRAFRPPSIPILLLANGRREAQKIVLDLATMRCLANTIRIRRRRAARWARSRVRPAPDRAACHTTRAARRGRWARRPWRRSGGRDPASGDAKIRVELPRDKAIESPTADVRSVGSRRILG